MNSINFIINLVVSLTFIYLLQLLALLTTLQLVSAHPCLQSKCNCVYQKNKLSADCSLQKLTSLPQQESDSPPVQAINLTRNNIFELKRNIFSDSNLVNLQKIYIQRVGLERVDENAFHKLKNLIELDISYNSLKYIPSQSFAAITKLRSLDLSSNLIPSVPNHSFQNLTNLKTLSLERNRIVFIDDNAFIGLVNLETLKLSENYLTNIRSQSLLPLINVHSVTLSENKWKCDCSLRSVRKFLLANPRINVPDEPKCVDNTTQHRIWTLMGLDSFLCPPVISNHSSSPNQNLNEGSTLRLECAVVLFDDDDYHLQSIKWLWNNIPISNNSKGCGEDCLIKNSSQQYFTINENIDTNKKLKISRLELSSVQTLNSGPYICVSKNNAGAVQRIFNVLATGHDPKKAVTAAAASSESHFVNDSEDKKTKDDGTDKVVIGLILGILFGVLLVLILLGISIILLCRRRRRKPMNNRNDSISEETELEKLTNNSNSTLKVNPIQKPPRLALNKYNSDKEMPKVWLIDKHNINGNSNLIRDQSYAESDYSTQLLFNDNYNDSQNISESIEPDLIHPSAYMRDRHIHVTDLDQLSVHSDGTEV